MKLAHDNGKLVSFDVNYRDTLWENEAACKEVADQVYDYVDFLKISEEELYFVGGEENIPAFMKEHGISVVIETLGADGANTSSTVTPDISRVTRYMQWTLPEQETLSGAVSFPGSS